MNKQQRNIDYLKYVEAQSPKSAWFTSLLRAFIMGGTVCALGQMISDIIKSLNPLMDLSTVSAWVSISIITITILLTAFGS